MDRRELLQMIAAVTGCALVANDELWASADPQSPLPYSGADVDLLDDVAETILPRTDTPGARDAAVGPFIARYSAACYPPERIALLQAGLRDIDAQMRSLHGTGFRQASRQAQESLLVEIDRQAKAHARAADAAAGGDPPHYFTLIKQLTLLGFFTSEPGETRVARYRPVPGRYQGCIPYKGETFWAW
ncbi:MAG TPA: gluconate 2-dehydrogenase subunit 3 family protein [Steroidobacteraceae bacterium]|nr:gluconate 2-dehydrogenase subunit 3 family protein [Steroidobacteraceae bacterium]